MIYQIAGFESIEWIFGLGLMFGLAFLMNWYLKGNIRSFMILLLFFSGFMVSAELFDAWVMILIMILDVVIIGMEIKENRGMS